MKIQVQGQQRIKIGERTIEEFKVVPVEKEFEINLPMYFYDEVDDPCQQIKTWKKINIDWSTDSIVVESFDNKKTYSIQVNKTATNVPVRDNDYRLISKTSATKDDFENAKREAIKLIERL